VLAAPSTSSAAVGTGSFGSSQLLVALGAAAFGSFVSIPWTLAGGVILGMVNQLTLYETGNAGTAQLVVLLLILGVVFVRGARIGAVFSSDGVQVDDRPPLRIPVAARTRAVVRHQHRLLVAAGLLLAVVAPYIPALRSEGSRFQLSVILVFAVVGISLTLLIGWGGQLSLGHFAVVGIGAFIGTRQAAEGRSLVLLLLLAAVLGAAVLVAIGIPALRVRGLTLAVTTLGLAVVSSEWLFRTTWFTGSDTGFVQLAGVIPPLRGLHPKGMLAVYWTTLVVLVVVAAGASRIRRTALGRQMIAVRDDERAAAAYGITPVTTKLTVLAISGGIAGMAGVLWANAWQTVSAGQFPPELSLAVLAVPVIGGLGSVAGAIAGAVFLYFPTFFWSRALDGVLGDSAQAGFQLVFSGLNVLIVLLVFPTGLAGAAQRLWERLLRRGQEAPAIEEPGPAARGAAPAPAGPILSARGIDLRFGGLLALQGASIDVGAGEIVGLIGPNGAGKSTLLNVLSGVLRPDAGTVELEGEDITTDAPEVRAALGMGRSFQAATLFPGLTVRETVQARLAAASGTRSLSSLVATPWVRRAEREQRAVADELLARMGLTPWADALTSSLSTGTRRICDLAVQVAGRPKVLLLDEPTGGVAQREAEAFGPLLRRLSGELDCAIVIVEHDMPLLMGLCDRVYALVQGHVIAEGTPEEIRSDPLVVASYLGTDEVAIARSGATVRAGA
jgi:ABC-type branched-subunit amino acid transport system ATPase component/ABC-type branched-subunit amino acid transport system permease subunit